jgi:4-amino-4-deoxy-L-arabinose transferase-like glycosyltransferase
MDGADRAKSGTHAETRRFWIALLLIVVAGLAWRLLYITVVSPRYAQYGDPFFYHQQANFLAHGHGFANPSYWHRTHRYIASAFHPPLYPMVLSISSFLGFSGYTAHRVTSCVIGAGVVLVLGLVGRRIGGNRAGLIAAFLAAAYPNLWMIDGILFPEGLFALTIGLTLLAAYRLRDRPNAVSAVLLGVSITLATLTRGEAIVLVAFLALPLIVLMRALTWRKRVQLLLVACLATAATMAPWTIRNLTTFKEPIILSSNGDAVLAFANCPEVYSGRFIGLWYTRCPRSAPTGDESQVARAYRDMGLRYMRDHADRLPVVVAARVGRIWQVYRPFQNVWLSTGELRPRWAALAGLWTYWVMLPFAAFGGWLTWRRKVSVIPLVAQVVLVTFIAATVYATSRFALPADVVILVLTGVAIDGIITWIRSGTFPSRVPAASDATATPGEVVSPEVSPAS